MRETALLFGIALSACDAGPPSGFVPYEECRASMRFDRPVDAITFFPSLATDSSVVTVRAQQQSNWVVTASCALVEPECDGGRCVAVLERIDVCLAQTANGCDSTSPVGERLSLSNCAPMRFHGSSGGPLALVRDSTRFAYRRESDAGIEEGAIEVPAPITMSFGNLLRISTDFAMAQLDTEANARLVWEVP